MRRKHNPLYPVKWYALSPETTIVYRDDYIIIVPLPLGKKGHEMSRDINKAIAEYERITDGTSKGCFWESDVRQIHDMSASEIHMIFNALRAGWALGYKAGRRVKENEKA